MIVDLFAGPGGWSVGLRLLGLTDLGIEYEPNACNTRRAAGHPTIEADVSELDPHDYHPTEGLIASPPCPDFSRSGNRAGLTTERGQLVYEPLRWTQALRPRWVALENVPEVLPIWREIALQLAADGYSTWAGTLNAADYGVPQTRRRAFLLAALDRPAEPPPPTHDAAPARQLDGTQLEPWRTMADALGWPPSYVLDTRRDQRPDGSRQKIPATRPAATITAAGSVLRVITPDDDRLVTLAEAAALQTFRPDYPFAGDSASRWKQLGNAVPPLLAAHVLAAVTGRPVKNPARP